MGIINDHQITQAPHLHPVRSPTGTECSIAGHLRSVLFLPQNWDETGISPTKHVENLGFHQQKYGTIGISPTKNMGQLGFHQQNIGTIGIELTEIGMKIMRI